MYAMFLFSFNFNLTSKICWLYYSNKDLIFYIVVVFGNAAKNNVLS